MSLRCYEENWSRGIPALHSTSCLQNLVAMKVTACGAHDIFVMYYCRCYTNFEFGSGNEELMLVSCMLHHHSYLHSASRQPASRQTVLPMGKMVTVYRRVEAICSIDRDKFSAAKRTTDPAFYAKFHPDRCRTIETQAVISACIHKPAAHLLIA